MTKWITEGVQARDLAHVWDDVWPYLRKAIDRFPNAELPYTEEEIVRRLFRKTMQLWIGWNVEEHRVSGALITEITHDDKHPGKVFCSVPLVGGERWNEWGDDLWNEVKKWAVEKGCTHALGYGRKGWKRLYGFDDCGTTQDGIPMFVRRLKR